MKRIFSELADAMGIVLVFLALFFAELIWAVLRRPSAYWFTQAYCCTALPFGGWRGTWLGRYGG
jgi:hypothetical protein